MVPGSEAVSIGRGRLFAALPELELPRRFSVGKAKRMIGRVHAKRRRSLLQKRFEASIAAARAEG